MEEMTAAQRRRAFDEFSGRFDQRPSGLLPDGLVLPFDVCHLIERVQWQLPTIEGMVRGELNEITNILNQWMGSLRRWHAWLYVMDRHDSEMAWQIQWEFCEPIAFRCLFEPSAARDRFTLIATNAFHQIRCASDRRYPDKLDFDFIADKTATKIPPTRKNKEKQLKRILSPWNDGAALLKAIKSMDDAKSRTITGDFRNLSSHGLPPRLTIGLTKIVTRQVEPKMKLRRTADDFYDLVEVPNEYCISYAYGGTPPLSIRPLFEANRAEFGKARHCFSEYTKELDIALAGLPLRDEQSGL